MNSGVPSGAPHLLPLPCRVRGMALQLCKHDHSTDREAVPQRARLPLVAACAHCTLACAKSRSRCTPWACGFTGCLRECVFLRAKAVLVVCFLLWRRGWQQPQVLMYPVQQKP